MNILIAEDGVVPRHALELELKKWGHAVVLCHDGQQAWEALQKPDAPSLVILDWVMPGMDGIEVCRRLRASGRRTYVILLSGRCAKEDVAEGLTAGADDYMTKPFNACELRARIHVGQRTLLLNEQLSRRVRELEAALAQVNELQGLLPICTYCKKIRDGQDYWQAVDQYVTSHSAARFTHGICPECFDRIAAEFADAGRNGA